MSSLFFDLSVDAKEFMLGNAIYFGNVKISKDDVYNSLILPSNILDKLTNVQKLYLGSLCIITRRVLDDHLEDEKYSNPDGKYSNPSQTDSIAERNFGILDRFTREKTKWQHDNL